MNLKLKKQIREQLPHGSIASICQALGKSRPHVSNVFRFENYNDQEVIDAALNIIEGIKQKELLIKEALK